MFDINNYPSIILHLKTISRRYHIHSSGWIECFCPYCDDGTRKLNPSHGHFYIGSNIAYCHCFRCGIKLGLYKFLIDTSFSDTSLIEQLKHLSGFVYNKSKISGIKTHNTSRIQIFEKINNQYNWMKNNHPDQLQRYFTYLKSRCLDIDPFKFFLLPSYKNNNLQVQFLNYNGELITARNIDNAKVRYEIFGSQKYYYFQDLLNVDIYNSIIITEGAFDIINLYNYYYPFKDSFFICIGGNNYKGIVTDIINSLLLIGKYIIRIVLDRGLKFQTQIINSILNAVNILNPEIILEFYLPSLSKDVSELMLLVRI